MKASLIGEADIGCWEKPEFGPPLAAMKASLIGEADKVAQVSLLTNPFAAMKASLIGEADSASSTRR